MSSEVATVANLRLLNQHEVALAWHMIFFAVKKSELYRDDTQIVNLLLDAHAGRIQCWILKGDEGLKAVIMTQMFWNKYTGNKTFTLTHANSLESVSDDEWSRIYGTLIQFARGEHCNRIEVFTDNGRAKDILRQHDFSEQSVYRKEI